jgi:hypothetical protein
MKNIALVMMSLVLFTLSLIISGCVPTSTGTGGAASLRANEEADKSMYKPMHYTNADKKGPTLIVLPGNIKSSNASFTQKMTPNNIADFAEIELSNANFRVLERSDVGPMLNEMEMAVNMGDPEALKKFKRGKFKSTKWFVKFDVLKAEKVAGAGQGFDGNAIGSIFGTIVGGVTGSVGNTAIASTKAGEAAEVWIVGIRYKIVDASTTEQLATGYVEKKMETGKKAQALLGMSGSAEQFVTLDTVVQRVVQEAVVQIDKKK